MRRGRLGWGEGGTAAKEPSAGAPYEWWQQAVAAAGRERPLLRLGGWLGSAAPQRSGSAAAAGPAAAHGVRPQLERTAWLRSSSGGGGGNGGRACRGGSQPAGGGWRLCRQPDLARSSAAGAGGSGGLRIWSMRGGGAARPGLADGLASVPRGHRRRRRRRRRQGAFPAAASRRGAASSGRALGVALRGRRRPSNAFLGRGSGSGSAWACARWWAARRLAA